MELTDRRAPPATGQRCSAVHQRCIGDASAMHQRCGSDASAMRQRSEGDDEGGGEEEEEEGED
eukprot:4995164-Pyramimonas_sp.AAC.1